MSKTMKLLLSAGMAVLVVLFGSGRALAVGCKTLPRNACIQSAQCTWVKGYTRKDGRKVAAYCRKKGSGAHKRSKGSTGNGMSANSRPAGDKKKSKAKKDDKKDSKKKTGKKTDKKGDKKSKKKSKQKSDKKKTKDKKST